MKSSIDLGAAEQRASVPLETFLLPSAKIFSVSSTFVFLFVLRVALGPGTATLQMLHQANVPPARTGNWKHDEAPGEFRCSVSCEFQSRVQCRFFVDSGHRVGESGPLTFSQRPLGFHLSIASGVTEEQTAESQE